MIVIQNFSDAPRLLRQQPTAVTIGNFDGCHIGHQRLIETTKVLARELHANPIAVTFTPRPDAFFHQVTSDRRLFTDEQKLRAFQECGLSAVVLKKFDKEFSELEAVEFYQRHLRHDLNAVAVVVGDNFRFGKDRLGDAKRLVELGLQDGIQVIAGGIARHDGTRISSTRIRTALEQGDVENAAAMLGRPYLLEGFIRRGDQLGRTLGVPTANLEDIDQLIPAFGIYAGYVWMEGLSGAEPQAPLLRRAGIPAVFSIGIRPTLKSTARPPLRIEAHLLEGLYGTDDFYGRRAAYYLTNRLREERRFPDLTTLQAQMAEDIAMARAILARDQSEQGGSR